MTTFQFRLLVVGFMVFISFNLFRGLYFLVSGKGAGKNTARSLGWRIGLSMALFLVLVLLKVLGIVDPHALNEVPKVTIAPDDKKDEGKTLEEIQKQDDASGGRVRLRK